MKRSTVAWGAGGVFVFFITILIIMYFTLQPGEAFENVRHTIEEQVYPEKLKKRFSIRLGPVSLFIVKKALKSIDVYSEMEYDISDLVEEINSGEFGLYEFESEEQKKQLIFPQEMELKLLESGWKRFLRVRENHSMVGGFYRDDNGHGGILFYVVDNNDLVIAKVGT